MSSFTIKSFYWCLLIASMLLMVGAVWLLSLTSDISLAWVQEEQAVGPRVVTSTRPKLVSLATSHTESKSEQGTIPTVDLSSSLHQNYGPPKEDATGLAAIFNGSMPSFTVEEVQKRSKAGHVRLDDVKQDKWIVVTSIAPPTDDVKYLAGLKGWTVLVVGDSKTPSDWSFPNCIYLSVEKQKQLGLELVPLIPFAHYGRKMIGYLYAIAHGAQVIYETDDDTRPTDQLQSFIFTDTMTGLMFGGERVFNPYRHFGQSTLWPRGYPLTYVGANNGSDYRLANSWKTPVIQQGTVKGDPDMGAIFRLTRKFTNSRLEVKFDPAGPPVILPEGVFTPYNAQNTLYLKNALWSFYFPLTTDFRVTDIWRSYWAQRLLWEIDEHLGYFPPNAYQQRNSHNYLDDFKDEDQFYKDTEELLDFLYEWRCPARETFFQCVYRLYIDMAKNHFLGERDIEGMQKWLNDLVRLGYPEPERKALKRLNESNSGRLFGNNLNPLDKLRNQTLKKGIYTHFVPAEQIPPTINRHGLAKPNPSLEQLEKISSVCENMESVKVPPLGQTTKANEHFKDVLLVVIFNHPFYKNLHILEAVYRSIFPNIAYCGPRADMFFNALKDPSLGHMVTFLEMDNFKHGIFGYRCAARAMSISLNVTGYFFVGDDDIINIWNFYSFNKENIWLKKPTTFMMNATDFKWSWWSFDVGKEVYVPAYDELRHWSHDPPPPEVIPPEKFVATLASNIGPYPWTCHAISDVYYIPARLRESARFYFDFYDERKVFLELAVPTVLHGLGDRKTFEFIKGVDLWDQDRRDPWSKYDSRLGYLHPIKLSHAPYLEKLCSVYFPLLQTHGKSVNNVTISFVK